MSQVLGVHAPKGCLILHDSFRKAISPRKFLMRMPSVNLKCVTDCHVGTFEEHLNYGFYD